MKAFLIRIFLLLFSVVLCIQLWIFASLAWWRFNPVNTTMMMRIDYWTEPSIQTALSRNKEQGKVVAGGSTISQQLAKNLFLFNKRSFLRKGQEAVATWMMERMWSKERILEVYLNSIEFGHHIYGVEAAAKHYFGKTSESLTREEAIFLAAILTNPKYFEENRNASALKARKRMIQRYMRYAELP